MSGMCKVVASIYVLVLSVAGDTIELSSDLTKRVPVLATPEAAVDRALAYTGFVKTQEFSSSKGNRCCYLLYPIFCRNSIRCFLSSSPSIPLGVAPSTTPMIPRPCSVSTIRTSAR